MSKKNKKYIASLITAFAFLGAICYQYVLPSYAYKNDTAKTEDVINVSSHDNEPYQEVNNNKPTFTSEEKKFKGVIWQWFRYLNGFMNRRQKLPQIYREQITNLKNRLMIC